MKTMKFYQYLILIIVFNAMFLSSASSRGFFFFNGDTEAPVITLKGDAEITLYQHTAYTDEGATAEDNEDGDITDKIVVVNPVDTATIGDYTVTYDVKDKADNEAEQVKRVVHVLEDYNRNITLKGKDYIYVSQNTPYRDPGYFAKDIHYNNIEVKVENNVDTSTLGKYKIVYKNKDDDILFERIVEVVAAISEQDNTIFTKTINWYDYMEGWRLEEITLPVLYKNIIDVRFYINGKLYHDSYAIMANRTKREVTKNFKYSKYTKDGCYSMYIQTLFRDTENKRDVYASSETKLFGKGCKLDGTDPIIVEGVNKYYVSTKGDDENTGHSQDEPFKTIKKAISIVQEDDEIYIEAGVYRVSDEKMKGLSLNDSYVKIENYGEGEVIIKGSTVVKKWEYVKNNIWKLPSEENDNSHLNRTVHYQQVFYNDGKQLQKIGYPNYISDWEKVHDKSFFIYKPIKNNNLALGLDDENINKMSAGTFYVPPHDDDGKFDLYIWLPNDENPNDDTYTIEVSNVKLGLINSSVASHVIYKGLTFMHTALQSVSGSRDAFQGGAALRAGDDTLIENCIFAYTDFAGLTIGSSHPLEEGHTVIRNSIFHHNGAVGIAASALGGLLIENNEFHHNAVRPFNVEWHTAAIKIASDAWAKVRNNYIHDEYGHGIWFDGCRVDFKKGIVRETNIYNNIIDGTGIDNNESGLRLLPYKGNNIFLEISSHINAYNNICNNARSRGIYVATAWDINVMHNFVMGSKLNLFYLADQLRSDNFKELEDHSRFYPDAQNVIIENNIFYDTQKLHTSFGLHAAGIVYHDKEEDKDVTVTNKFSTTNKYKNNIFYSNKEDITTASDSRKQEIYAYKYTTHGNDGEDEEHEYDDWNAENDIWSNPEILHLDKDIVEWKLDSDSPAIDASIYEDNSSLGEQIKTDVFGNNRDNSHDIGPFEY